MANWVLVILLISLFPGLRAELVFASAVQAKAFGSPGDVISD